MSGLFDRRCECPLSVGSGRRPWRSSIRAKCEKPEIGAEAAISPGMGECAYVVAPARASRAGKPGETLSFPFAASHKGRGLFFAAPAPAAPRRDGCGDGDRRIKSGDDK